MQQTQRTGNQERSERREAAQATSKRARKQAERRARLTHRRRAKAQPLPRPTERHPTACAHLAMRAGWAKRGSAQGESAHAVGGSRVVGRSLFDSHTLARGVTQARTAPAPMRGAQRERVVAHRGRTNRHGRQTKHISRRGRNGTITYVMYTVRVNRGAQAPYLT